MKNEDTVKSLLEAQDWFLADASGTVIAHHPKMGDRIRICETYAQAAEYFAIAENLSAF